MRLYNKASGYFGGIVIGAMMLLVAAEVGSRHFFGSSIESTVEIVGISLALAVFLGFSPCEEGDKHVRVELVVRLLPQRVAIVLELIVYIMAITIVFATAWQVGLNAYSSWKIGEVLPGANLQVPVYPTKIAAFFGYLTFGFQLAENCIAKVRHNKRTVFDARQLRQ